MRRFYTEEKKTLLMDLNFKSQVDNCTLSSLLPEADISDAVYLICMAVLYQSSGSLRSYYDDGNEKHTKQ